MKLKSRVFQQDGNIRALTRRRMKCGRFSLLAVENVVALFYAERLLFVAVMRHVALLTERTP
jgi:hypothetical protein